MTKKITKKIPAVGKPDPEIHVKKTVFMQRISDFVRTGHSRYITGTIAIDKVRGLADKFSRMYDCFTANHTASRARKAQLYVCRMLFWNDENTGQVTWILLVLAVEKKKDENGIEQEIRHWIMPEAANQKWRDSHIDRIQLTGYELVRLTHETTALEKAKLATLKKRVNETDGDEKKKIEKALYRATVAQKNKLNLTWRYTRLQHDSLREAVLRAIRSRRDDDLRRLIQSLWKTPGFSGARVQVKKFRELILKEWKTSRGKEPAPEIPKNLGFVRRLENNTIKASQLQRNWEKTNETNASEKAA